MEIEAQESALEELERSHQAALARALEAEERAASLEQQVKANPPVEKRCCNRNEHTRPLFMGVTYCVGFANTLHKVCTCDSKSKLQRVLVS